MILAVMALFGSTAFGQCEDLYDSWQRYKARYTLDSTGEYTWAGCQARKAAYRDCVASQTGDGEGMPWRTLNLEQRIIRQRKNTNGGLILMFTPAAPIGGIILIVAQVRQNHINYALYQEAVK